MDYNKDNIAKDKAQTWKTFNKLTIYTIVFVAIILVIIFFYFKIYSSSLKKYLISISAFSCELIHELNFLEYLMRVFL